MSYYLSHLFLSCKMWRLLSLFFPSLQQPTLITHTSAWIASTPHCPRRRGSLTFASTAGPVRPAWPARCQVWPTPTPPPTSPPVSRRSASFHPVSVCTLPCWRFHLLPPNLHANHPSTQQPAQLANTRPASLNGPGCCTTSWPPGGRPCSRATKPVRCFLKPTEWSLSPARISAPTWPLTSPMSRPISRTCAQSPRLRGRWWT